MKEKFNLVTPLIINEGIVYKKRDMLVLLRDLGKVAYYEIVGGQIRSSGRGYLMRLSCNNDEPTLFLNGRIYINVSGFEYLKLTRDPNHKENTVFELFGDKRWIKIVPEETLRPVPYAEREFMAERNSNAMMDEFMPPEDMGYPPEFLDGGGLLGN